MKKQKETFWEMMRRVAKKVDDAPDWAKAGINLNERNFITYPPEKHEMKISPFNKLMQLFVVDPYANDFFSYDCEIDTKRVIVDKHLTANGRIRIQSFGDHINIEPYEIESEAEFNRLGIEAILLAHRELEKNQAASLADLKTFYKEMDIDGPHALLISSDEYAHNVYLASKYCVENFVKLQMWPEVPKGYAYALPDPEFFGVISENVNKENHYGIGIVNTKSIVRVYLGDALAISQNHLAHMEDHLTLCDKCQDKVKRLFGGWK